MRDVNAYNDVTFHSQKVMKRVTPFFSSPATKTTINLKICKVNQNAILCTFWQKTTYTIMIFSITSAVEASKVTIEQYEKLIELVHILKIVLMECKKLVK